MVVYFDEDYLLVPGIRTGPSMNPHQCIRTCICMNPQPSIGICILTPNPCIGMIPIPKKQSNPGIGICIGMNPRGCIGINSRGYFGIHINSCGIPIGNIGMSIGIVKSVSAQH